MSPARAPQGLIFLLVAVLMVPLARHNLAQLVDRVDTVGLGQDHGGDFILYFAAGKLYDARHDLSAYDLDLMREEELAANPKLRTDDMWNEQRVNILRNPPLCLPLLAVTARYPLPTGFMLFTTFEAALLGALLVISLGLAAERAQPLGALAWIMLCAGWSHFWQALHYGQVPACLAAFSFALAVVLLRQRRLVAAGLAFSVLVLKFQYLIPIGLFLLLTRGWRALAALAAGCLAAAAASCAAVGPAGFLKYFSIQARLASAPHGLYFFNYEHMFNWRGVFERMLGQSAPAAVVPLAGVMMLVVYAAAAWVFRSQCRLELKLVALSFTMIAAAPHCHGQDLDLLLPALALLVEPAWRVESPAARTAGAALGLALLFWVIPAHLDLAVVLLTISVLGLARVANLREYAAVAKEVEPTRPNETA